jgi:mono/diheme cytochrome c family protein
MKRYRRFIDALLVLAGIAIVIFLLRAPPATTPAMPVDDIHRKLVDSAFEQGKKSAEQHCASCHNPDNIAFTADHPAGNRCLFCHRLPARQPSSTPNGR